MAYSITTTAEQDIILAWAVTKFGAVDETDYITKLLTNDLLTQGLEADRVDAEYLKTRLAWLNTGQQTAHRALLAAAQPP